MASLFHTRSPAIKSLTPTIRSSNMNNPRRDLQPRGVTENLVHFSTSLDASRRWYSIQVANQLQTGQLFEDPYFPANDATIKRKAEPNIREYEWLRPTQITQTPKFIIDGISRFDVQQGEIGNCWFLAAVSSLSIHPTLLDRVVPSGQSFDARTSDGDRRFAYCGMFLFRFWRFGEWYDVVVDDRLPTRHRQLVFVHSSNRNEFWSALLEKAYVKLFGSYEAMRGGNTAEAMEDMTGGLTELVELSSKPPADIYRLLDRAHSRCSLIASSIDAPADQIGDEGPMGLILGHAYSVTDVRQFMQVNKSGDSNQIDLVRLRNPWGNGQEWFGPWSDRSAEWSSISKSECKRIGLVIDNDGEFWMSLDDFCQYFSRLEFCHLGPESGDFGQSSYRNESGQRRWDMRKEESEWVKFSTAGGCRNNEKTFHMNPQFRVHVIDPDETDNDKTGTIIIGLMQKGRRESFQPPHTIGYSIYRLPANHPHGELLPRCFFESNLSVARSPSFVNVREVCGRHKLSPGEYMIIPSTFEPNKEAKFLLRIFSERPCKSNELDDILRVDHKNLAAMSNLSLDTNTNEELYQAYSNVVGETGEITATELQAILNKVFTKDFPSDGFTLETARSMVALMDSDLSCGLGFPEFQNLWVDLQIWKTMFKKYDIDGNGYFDSFELRELLRCLGIQMNNSMYNAIVCRYTNGEGRVSFEDYILLLVRLGKLVDIYKGQEHLRDGRAIFWFEDFIRTGIYV